MHEGADGAGHLSASISKHFGGCRHATWIGSQWVQLLQQVVPCQQSMLRLHGVSASLNAALPDRHDSSLLPRHYNRQHPLLDVQAMTCQRQPWLGSCITGGSSSDFCP